MPSTKRQLLEVCEMAQEVRDGSHTQAHTHTCTHTHTHTHTHKARPRPLAFPHRSWQRNGLREGRETRTANPGWMWKVTLTSSDRSNRIWRGEMAAAFF